MKLRTGKRARPRRTLCYGLHGVGKTFFASKAPKAFFLDIEGGSDDIDVFGGNEEPLKTYDDIVAALGWLYTADHQFESLVVDTADWAEDRICNAVAIENKKKTVAEIPYGKGPVFVAAKWQFLIDGFEALRLHRDMQIILLAHAKIRKFDSPESERYDRYEPDLMEGSSSLIQEWCDEVLFASFKIFTVQEDQGFGKTRLIARGGKERYIRTSEGAACLAKNRLNLPEELPMDWAALAKYQPQVPRREKAALAAPVDVTSGPLVDFPPADPDPNNIAGLVLDGSSKKAREAKETAAA